MRLSKSLGIVLLSIWLILDGLLALVNLNFPSSATVMAILALAAGILLLLGR